MTHPLEGRDYTGRFVMNGVGRTTWVWGILSWDGQHHEKWHILPDGRDIYDALDADGLAALSEPSWIKVSNHGKLPDIMWTGAGLFCFVSARLLRVLDEHDVSGYRSVPVELRFKRKGTVHGYSLLYFDDGESDEIRPYPPGRLFSDSFDTSARVKDALAQAGVTDLEIDDAADLTRRVMETL